MKNYVLLFICFIALISCKKSNESTTIKEKESVNNEKSEARVYPKDLLQVFEAHGGLEKWNQSQSLIFEIEKEGGNERTITNLKSRKSLIETKDYSLGFNGEVVWLKENEKGTFKSNAKFYYNLMFYFYAMPFILADDGITYKAVAPLEVDGKKYPGIEISYGQGVGESPDDQYILYYDQETHKMAWLGYTVTYFSKEKSKDWHFIKYSDWQMVNGFALPAKLEWHKSEGFKIGEKRNEMIFTNALVTKSSPDEAVFNPAPEAMIIE